MAKTTDNLQKLIIIGDRVLIKPKTASNKTKAGLLLPPGYSEKDEIQSGYVIKCGPGYPLPSDDMEESWKTAGDKIKYLPLQVREGDLAVFLMKSAYEINYNNEKYFVVPQHAILLLERDEAMFE